MNAEMKKFAETLMERSGVSREYAESAYVTLPNRGKMDPEVEAERYARRHLSSEQLSSSEILDAIFGTEDGFTQFIVFAEKNLGRSIKWDDVNEVFSVGGQGCK